MFFDIRGKKALIIGATAGIGHAMAERFVEAGADVIITGRRDDGPAIASKIGAEFAQADISKESDLQRIRDELFSESQLDILINNAGVDNSGIPLSEQTHEAFDKILAVNVLGIANALRVFSDVIKDGGVILNTSSVSAVFNVPGFGQYSATKATVDRLTQTAALELAPRGIRVNAICPGTFPSEMSVADDPAVQMVANICPLKRLGDPREVAAMAHYLASPEAAYVTGSLFTIDGGLTAGVSFTMLDCFSTTLTEG